MLVYVICYGAAMLFAFSAHFTLSGMSLMFAALYLYLWEYGKSGNPLHLRGLFSLFYVGGEGISCLKLSNLQKDWSLETWACFFVAFAAFWNVYALAEKKFGYEKEKKTIDGFSLKFTGETPERYGTRIFIALTGLTILSLTAFLFEAFRLGYVPFLLRGVPHAYSYFHISGVHYVTVSCVLVPSMEVLLWFYDREMGKAKRIVSLIMTGIALLIPVLCVSRFQLIFAVILAVLTFMIVSGHRKIRYLFMAAAGLVPLYVILTIARSHDVTYLNGIFEMKNAATPIFITQPYMYIANNYDNFDCLVRELPAHSMGLKGMFPLWALSGLKFIKPALVDWPIYVNKEELTTVTLFYDAYYDFGIAGVFLFSSVLGAAAAWLSARTYPGRNPAWYLFYSQGALYFMLSFFTTWYSNPTTWFYFVAVYGRENVYDFSLGNPNVPVPQVTEAILDVVKNEDFMTLHGYMSNAGYEDVRQTIAESLNKRFGTNFSFKNLIMTVGAASGLNIILKSILNPGDEVIVFAPYFVEYNAYVRKYEGNVVVIYPDTETFMPKLDEFEAKITAKTKAVIINNPNNPTGVVYDEATIKAMAAILEKKEKEFGTSIVLISDEPYRELAYGGVEVPFVTKYYHNAVVGYSYSKSLSVPGERIGYVVIPDEVDDSAALIGAATIANRVIGCVNAPSLVQKVIKYCIEHEVTVDLETYEKNRNLIYGALTEYGFTCAKPDGAFYLFVKSPVENEKEFCEVAKKHHVLVVPGSSFACPGYVRLAYCVSYDQIERSLPAFKKIAEEYGLCK